MLFTDPLFLYYFLPATLLALRLAARNRLNGLAKACIIGATLVFYAYENWLWVLVFLAVVGATYFYGWILAVSERAVWRRFWLGVAIGHCLLFLCTFKYLNWVSGMWPSLQPFRHWLEPWFGANGYITLPPGISFYVFEAVSYCFDIYRRKIRPAANPLDFLCFIAMFPRFIAGPIVRYADLEIQIKGWAGLHLVQGLSLFAAGFSMKCLLADQFSVFVPYAFAVPNPDLVQAWVGVIAYSFQLYFDFWAYSIMATGLGLCLGFEFPDNFRSPYHAQSISQFWRQWHISLSTWLRDYLYIPLGGSRVPEWRINLNLILTMLLGGLWHGANFTFIAWGTYHGLLLVLERQVGESRLARVPRRLRVAATFVLVAAGWALFRSENFTQAHEVLGGMAGLNGIAPQFNPLLLLKTPFAAVLGLLGLIFCIWGERWLVRDYALATIQLSRLSQWAIWLLFIAALFTAASAVEIPFLYFQF